MRNALSAQSILEMDNKKFSKELEERTKKFAVRIIRIVILITTIPYGEGELTTESRRIGGELREFVSVCVWCIANAVTQTDTNSRNGVEGEKRRGTSVDGI